MNVPNASDLSHKTTQPTQHQRLTTQAQKWVAQTFFGTMLKQMRNNPFKSDLFSGGRGGQAFGEMFDQQLADRMSRGSGSKLVKGIVRAIEKTGASAEHGRVEKTGIGYRVSGIGRAQSGAPRVESLNPTPDTRDPKPDFKNVRIHVAPDLGS